MSSKREFNTKQSEDYKKVEFKEFLNITWWVFKTVFSFEPFVTFVSVITVMLRDSSRFINPYIFALMLDSAISLSQVETPNIRDIYPYFAMYFGWNLFLGINGLFRNYYNNKLRNSLRLKSREMYYNKLSSLGIQTLEQPHINNKLFRANNSLTSLPEYMSQTVSLIGTVVNFISAVIIVSAFFPIFIPALIAVVIPFYLFDKKNRGDLYALIYRNTEANRQSHLSAGDLSASEKLQEISLTGALGFFGEKFTSFQIWVFQQRMNIIKRWQTGNYLFGTITEIATFAGYIAVFKSLLARTITIGQTSFQVRSLDSLREVLLSLVREVNDLSEFSFEIRDVYAVFQIHPAHPDGSLSLPILQKGPELGLKNVAFKYPNSESEIIKHLNLTIKSGEKIAIVGHNGAGKTTLVKMLCRFYRPTSGNIFVNNLDLNDLAIDTLYQNMGILFQDYNTYPQLTVKENIYVGKSNEPIDEVAIRSAAISADAIGFIEDFPNKFDQLLSEKFKDGIRLSTGQWQKIAIARFFYRNAPFVIFDEPTAAIDAVSEYNIFNKIYEFFTGKTVIIISHRFSTVRNADRIIVMEKGEIIEEGTHNHLMSINGYYAKSFLLQAEGYANSSAE